MRPFIAIVMAAGLSGLGVPAAAQQQPPQPPVSPPPFSRSPMALDRHLDNIVHAQRYDWEAFLAGDTSDLPAQSLERIDRANRISGMIERGLCDEARALANAEGDRNMALRVRQICRPARD